MHYVIIEYDDSGVIQRASVQSVQNVGTWEADGYLVFADGLERPTVGNVAVYDADQPWTHDLLSWWRDGKYYIDTETGDVYEVDGWEMPDTSPPPEPELPPEEPI